MIGTLAPSPTGGVLDLQEEIAAVPPKAACERWPEAFLLTADDGTRTKGICGSSNLCGPCARVRALENAELVALDAMKGNAPTLFMVLTTSLTDDALKRSKVARDKVHQAIYERWPLAEWACILEYTTGDGLHSGGLRRPHWNYTFKNIPAEDREELRAVASGAWCPRMDAEPAAQHVGQLYEVGGLMRYLVLHFHKPGQAPPAGYTGHRFTSSRSSAARGTAGYFGRPMPEVREEARESLRVKRHMHAVTLLGLVGEEALWAVEQRIREDLARVWELVRVQPVPTDWDPEGRPCSWTDVDVPIGRAAAATTVKISP